MLGNLLGKMFGITRDEKRDYYKNPNSEVCEQFEDDAYLDLDDENFNENRTMTDLGNIINIDRIPNNIMAEARGLSPDEVRMALRIPEITPCMFDQTIEFWLERISLWGNLNITYVDPNSGRSSKVTKNFLLKAFTDDTTIKLLGMWEFKKTGLNSCEAFRVYRGLDGKMKKEIFKIKIELDKEIKQAMKGKF